MAMMARNALLPATTCTGSRFRLNGTDIIDTTVSFYREGDNEPFFSGNHDDSLKNFDMASSKAVAKFTAPESFHILLIGNERSERQAIYGALAHQLNFPASFMEAWSGEIALQILGSNVIDLIIFRDDIGDMDGLEFLDRLHKENENPEIPVIEILNSGAASTGIQAMKMGAHDYLLKDFDGKNFELLPILVSRIYAEQQTMSVLRQTTGVHQAISESIPSVIYQLSLQGGRHEVRISRQIAELGLSADKWGNDAELHHQMCHAEDRPVVRKALEHSYRTGAPFQCDYRINAIGNSLRWFRDKAKIVKDKYGHPLFMQGVMMDITSAKAQEVELMQYRHMFENMLRQRTERLNRRIDILESCNSRLSDRYSKAQKMYIDLLGWVKAHETGGGSNKLV